MFLCKKILTVDGEKITVIMFILLIFKEKLLLARCLQLLF